MRASRYVSAARGVVCLGIVFVLGSHPVHAGESSPALRVLNPRIDEVLDTFAPVSPTLRALVDELKRSDLIVHVSGLRQQPGQHLWGETRFVHSAGGRRFVRVAVNDRLPRVLLASALAHEFQHALEIARAESVVDRASFAALYSNIGVESSGHPSAACYDTDEALAVGKRVEREVRAALGDPTP